MNITKEEKAGFVPVGEILSQIRPGDCVTIQIVDFLYQGLVQFVDGGHIVLEAATIKCPHFTSPNNNGLILIVFIQPDDRISRCC